MNAEDIFRCSIGCEIMLMIKARIRLKFSRYIFILDYMTHELTNLNKLYNGMNVHNSRFISTKVAASHERGHNSSEQLHIRIL